MSRLICPYAEDDMLTMTCILEAQGESEIDCDKCIYGKGKRTHRKCDDKYFNELNKNSQSD